jgi:hypothetical protein
MENQQYGCHAGIGFILMPERANFWMLKRHAESPNNS